MLWRFHRVYNADRQYADHARPVTYAMRPPPAANTPPPRARDLYVHLGPARSESP
jgi:magnesium-protoporphyrin IX monomethyl ester (oxidative) cyclase